MTFKELKENIDKISKKIFDIKTETKERRGEEGFMLDVWVEKLGFNDEYDDRSLWHVICSNESLELIRRSLSSTINRCIDYNEDEEVHVRVDVIKAYKIEDMER